MAKETTIYDLLSTPTTTSSFTLQMQSMKSFDYDSCIVNDYVVMVIVLLVMVDVTVVKK